MKNIDTNKWKEFNLSDIFEITGTKTTHKKNVEKNPGNFPYITTSAKNNGISGWTSIWTEEKNVFCVDSAVRGTMTYQNKNFCASDHVEKLIPKFLVTENIALFFCTVWNKTIISDYSYKISQKVMKKMTIKLPCKNDLIDFEFIENFMNKINNKVDKTINFINDYNI